MTNQTSGTQNVGGRGKIIVAVLVVALVAAVIAFALLRDDNRSTPLEDAAAGRPLTTGVADPTDSDPALGAEDARPQGREAPDSNEGEVGSANTTRDTPVLNPGTPLNTTPQGADAGRNAPPPAGADRQSPPNGSLTRDNDGSLGDSVRP